MTSVNFNILLMEKNREKYTPIEQVLSVLVQDSSQASPLQYCNQTSEGFCFQS